MLDLARQARDEGGVFLWDHEEVEMAPEYLVLGIGVEEATLERGVASSGHGLATSQWFFPNSAEGLWDMGGLSWQAAGTGPEISGSNLILK